MLDLCYDDFYFYYFLIYIYIYMKEVVTQNIPGENFNASYVKG
jgi:hypothetical protein